MEDDALGHGAECPQLVEGTENIQIGGSPCGAAAPCIAGFRDPDLPAGAVDVPLLGVVLDHASGNVQIILAGGPVRQPVGVGHHGSQPLSYAVVIMVAVHVQLFLHPLQQNFQRHILQKAVAAPGRLVSGVAVGGALRSAGTHEKAVGVIFPQPAGKDILIFGIQLRGVALGAAGHFQQVGLVDELHRVNGLAVCLAEGEDLLGLTGVPRLVRMVQTLTVGHADQELGSHSLTEIQHSHPLLAVQDSAVALRHLAAGMAVEIVVGLGGPAAGDPDPRGADLFGQRPQLLIVEVDGVIILHQPALGEDIGVEAALHFKGLRACDLAGGVGFPEGAAGDFRHLDVVRYQPLIANVQLTQGFGVQLHELCHSDSPFHFF